MSLIGLLIFLLICVALFYVIGLMGLPEPAGKIVRIVLGIILLIYLLAALDVFAVGPVLRLR